MRWLPLVLVLALVACESRVIVTRTPGPSDGATPASGTPQASATARATPAKLALQQVPNLPPAARLISYERGGDIGQPTLRFLLTSDGLVISQDTPGQLTQRKLTPSGAANMLLQALQTGFFERDADLPRVTVPGTTPPAHGPTVLILNVANGTRDVRVTLVPTGQPDDELYQKSVDREKLTNLARGYEDLAWVPQSAWADSRSQPYRAPFHRLFVLAEPNAPTGGFPQGTADADAVWPFLTPIDTVGETMTGTAWRCVVLVDSDAQALSSALTAASGWHYETGTLLATAALSWRNLTGSVRLQIGPLLPNEAARCAGASPPAF
jgi:hypothetical protein